VRPDFHIEEIRGNLNTRVKKLDDSNWAGMILARAGVVRLGWERIIGETLDIRTMLPAVGQGALGIETREGDTRVSAYVSSLHHLPTACATMAERALLRRLEGGCQVPIGTYGRMETAGQLLLDAAVCSIDGKKIVRGSLSGPPSDAEALGKRLADQLLAGGADEILNQIRGMADQAS
jgi:hydroxymethylbilane synthase